MSGKYYFEAVGGEVSTSGGGTHFIGVQQEQNGHVAEGLYRNDGRVYDSSGSESSSGTSYTSGDVIGVAFDADTGKVWFAKNNTYISSGDPATGANPAFTWSTTNAITPALAFDNTSNGKTWISNFGQRPFTYTPPTGFKALNSKNLTPNVSSIIRPQRHFDVLLYTPVSGSNTHYGDLEFTPDLVWFKSRAQAYSPYFFDVVRGTGQKALNSATNDQEGADTTSLTSFDRGGFTLPVSGINDTGSGTDGVVAWCWKAGGAAVSNSDGTITTSISANQTAGLSVVTYTGTGSAATIGHGLGKAPKVVITKLRDTTTQDWFFLTGEIYNDRGKYQKFNESGSIASDTNVYPATATTSTVYSVGTDNAVNGSGSKYVAYCWAEIPGYSKFGKYRGNYDANGTYIHLGFRPALLIVKKSTDDNWYIADYKRDPTNPGDHRLFGDVNSVEGGVGQEHFDFLSNGFKWRRAKNPFNNNDTFFFYMAFARRPGLTPYDTFPEAR